MIMSCLQHHLHKRLLQDPSFAILHFPLSLYYLQRTGSSKFLFFLLSLTTFCRTVPLGWSFLTYLQFILHVITCQDVLQISRRFPLLSLLNLLH
jgi:hypothetical protein